MFFAEPSGEQLHNLQLQCMATVLPYLTNYVWQQDPFTLHTSTVSKSPWSTADARRQHDRHVDQSVPEHLWGVTRFGDNIEDEWFILWLLNQITTKVSNCLLSLPAGNSSNAHLQYRESGHTRLSAVH